MSITLTPAAIARVQRYLDETPGAIGLRFGVTKTGCSGWQHVADLAKEERAGDTVFYGKYSGTDVTVDGEKFVILRESDLLGVLE